MQVIRSIGYRSLPIDASIPFDSKRFIVPNTHGKVTDCPGKEIVTIKKIEFWSENSVTWYGVPT